MRNRNNKQNKRKVKEDKKMNNREYKKRRRKNTVHDLRECPKAGKNGWEAKVPKTEKTFWQISLVNFFLKIFRSMNIL